MNRSWRLEAMRHGGERWWHCKRAMFHTSTAENAILKISPQKQMDVHVAIQYIVHFWFSERCFQAVSHKMSLFLRRQPISCQRPALRMRSAKDCVLLVVASKASAPANVSHLQGLNLFLRVCRVFWHVPVSSELMKRFQPDSRLQTNFDVWAFPLQSNGYCSSQDLLICCTCGLSRYATPWKLWVH